MATMKMPCAVGSGGASVDVTITPESTITSNMESSTTAIHIYGTFTVTSRININDIVFRLNPPPLTEFDTVIQASSDVRTLTVKTNGDVILKGSNYMGANTNCTVDFSYEYN